MFLQLCMALDHIHAKKMLHRDIKGANIFLTSTGVIKLGDFGFSHEYEETVSNAVAGTFCGTPYYLAPEVCPHPLPFRNTSQLISHKVTTPF